jgi:spore maturation protein CgeB
MKAGNLRLLYFGQATWGSTSLQRYFSLQQLFGVSYMVDSRRIFPDKNSGRTFFKSAQARIGLGPLISLSSKILIQEVGRFKPDVVWVDGGFLLSKNAIQKIQKRFKCQVIHYTPDSLTAPGKSNICMSSAISAYDITVTTKEQDMHIYNNLGAKRVIFSLQGYDPDIHKKIKLSESDKIKYNCDVSFVGQYMTDRAAAMEYLVDNSDVKLSIYGTGWDGKFVSKNLRKVFHGPAVADDYAKVVSGSKIILGFLNNKVKDLFTTRTFEIPACNGFLLAERSLMHEKLLIEGLEAEYFSSNKEMLYKINQYLNDDIKREEIASNGHKRVIESGYSWKALLEKIIAQI